MPMCCPAHSFHSVRLAQQGSRDGGQQPGAGLLKVRSPQQGQQTESTFTSVSGKPQRRRSRWSQLRPPFSRGFPAAVIRTPRQSLDNLASFNLLHPLATDKRCLWTTLADRLSSDVRVFCHAFVDFFPSNFLFHIFLFPVSHFYVTKRNNIGGAVIKMYFYPRVGITECMEMDIITKSYYKGNIILLSWLTLMIGFFLVPQWACHCSCCHGNKINLRINVVNRTPSHARMYL